MQLFGNLGNRNRWLSQEDEEKAVSAAPYQQFNPKDVGSGLSALGAAIGGMVTRNRARGQIAKDNQQEAEAWSSMLPGGVMSKPKPTQAPYGGIGYAQPATPTVMRGRGGGDRAPVAAPQAPVNIVEPSADPMATQADVGGYGMPIEKQTRLKRMLESPNARLREFGQKQLAAAMADYENAQNPDSIRARRLADLKMKQAEVGLEADQIALQKAKAGGTSEYQQRWQAAEMAGLKPGTEEFRRYFLEGKLGDGKSGNIYQDKYDAENAKKWVGKAEDLQDGATGAEQLDGTLERFGQLVEKVPGYQGGWGPTILELAPYDPTGLLGNKDDIAAGQELVGIRNQLALTMRNPDAGLGMPGAMSDADRSFLMRTVPTLENTPEGNRKMIQYMKSINKRKIDIANLANLYAERNGGRLDGGFNQIVRQYSMQNPMFPEDPPADVNPPTQTNDEWRYEGPAN